MAERHRGRLLALTVALLFAVACSTSTNGSNAQAPEFERGEGPLIRTRATAIVAARVQPDGSFLTIEYIGGLDGDVLANPCTTAYELQVDELTTPTTVTIWQLQPTVPPRQIESPDQIDLVCTAVGHQRELSVPLPAGFGDEIIDGSNDQIVPIVQLTKLLVPTVLPEGWDIIDTGAPPEPAATTTVFSDGTWRVFLRTTLLIDTLPPPVSGTAKNETLDNGIEAVITTTSDRHYLRFVHGSFSYEVSTSSDVPALVLRTIAAGLAEE